MIVSVDFRGKRDFVSAERVSNYQMMVRVLHGHQFASGRRVMIKAYDAGGVLGWYCTAQWNHYMESRSLPVQCETVDEAVAIAGYWLFAEAERIEASQECQSALDVDSLAASALDVYFGE